MSLVSSWVLLTRSKVIRRSGVIFRAAISLFAAGRALGYAGSSSFIAARKLCAIHINLLSTGLISIGIFMVSHVDVALAQKADCNHQIVPGAYRNSDDGSPSTFSEIRISRSEKNELTAAVGLNTVRSQLSPPVLGSALLVGQSEGSLHFKGTLHISDQCTPEFELTLSRISSLRRGGCEFFVEAILPILDTNDLKKVCSGSVELRNYKDLNSYRFSKVR